MKKFIYALCFAALGATYTSCDSLDMAPEDYFGSGNFWNNKGQVEGEINGLLSQLRGRYDQFYILGEIRGGTQRVGSSSLGTSLNSDDIRSNLITKDKTGIGNWDGMYGPIMQLNLFINKVTNECKFLSDKDRNNYLAQAHGLRALYYFLLYKTYGGVPLVTEVKLLDGKVSAEKFYQPRNTAEETLNFIKQEINKSEELYGSEEINNKFSKIKWSKAATEMLKAEIYLWSAKVTIDGHQATGKTDLTVAEVALQSLMGKFELLPNFSDVFSNAHKNNAEEIFALHFADGEATNWGNSFLYQDAVFINQVYGRNGKKITTDTLNLKGRGGVFRSEYTYDFWKSYDATDTRRDATFLEYYGKEDLSPASFGCVMKKAIGSINSNGNRIFDSDIIIYRYSDALLMMAEVANGLGKDCASYINEVRKRAYGKDYPGHEYVNGDYAANELAILHERDKEFVFEGKRWFDVVRMQDANHQSLAFSPEASYPTGKSIIPIEQKYMLLWPVDVSTLNDNPELKQTPGY